MMKRLKRLASMDPAKRNERLRRELYTFRVLNRKLSQDNLEAMGRENQSNNKTLIVYSEFDHASFFPNCDELPQRTNETEPYYDDLAAIADESYEVILCSGLLEHMTDPKRLIDECRRILTPGGKLILSASAVFSFHRGPDNYFHFTPHGLRLLMNGWSSVDIRGSSQPFETIGILLERILLQCEVFPLARPFIEFAAHASRRLDPLVLRQYDTRSFSDEREIDSMMPSNLQVIALK